MAEEYAAPVDRPPAAGTRTRTIAMAALLAALLAASAWITLPIGAVPVTLQVFVVLLAGLVLSPGTAAASVGVYLLLGMAGLPVFSGGTGGLGALLGPTGGYLVGFFFAAAVVSSVRLRLGRFGAAQPLADGLAMALGIAVIYAAGWAQLTLVTGMGWGPAFVAGVAPFVLLDAAKGVVAVGVASALRRAGVAAA
ncbi:MAG: biotin transporter BioY [Actinomycetota bacterium]|nr:biotin transporter BioY [Actinomycetota bacterium]